MEKREHIRDSTMTTAATANGGGSAVSWASVLGGAVGAAALSLILLVLGVGLGFSSVSPWAMHGIDATSFGVATILWITLTQLVASGAGGYIAGRLRTRWVGTHGDEIYFRDTVHGFLAWSIATLATAVIIASAVGSAISATAEVGASLAGNAATGVVLSGAAAASQKSENTSSSGGMSYYVETLFRKNPDAQVAAPSDVTGSALAPVSEAGRIVAHSLSAGSLSADDLRYVGQLVTQRTGMSQVDAEKRVSDTFARAKAAINDAAITAKEAADKARKASAYAALWLFVSLLVGAFVASLAATFGGRCRDIN